MSLEVKVALQKNRMDYIKKILDEIPQLTENPRKQDIVTRLQLWNLIGPNSKPLMNASMN